MRARVSSEVAGEVRLDLGYAYDGIPRPFSTQRFGGSLGGRDRDAELEALRAAASLSHVARATRGDRDGPFALTPTVVLRGLDAATFVPAVLPVLEDDPHVTVEVDGDLPDYEEVTLAAARAPGHLRRHATRRRGAGDWFDLRVTIELEGEEVPFEPLFGALARGEEVMFLESGTWFRLDRPELQRLRSLIDEARELADPESGALRLSARTPTSGTSSWRSVSSTSRAPGGRPTSRP